MALPSVSATASNSTPAADEVTHLKVQLRQATTHLVGLAATTARLPALESDTPYKAAVQTAQTALAATPAPTETEFRDETFIFFSVCHYSHQLLTVCWKAKTNDPLKRCLLSDVNGGLTKVTSIVSRRSLSGYLTIW